MDNKTSNIEEEQLALKEINLASRESRFVARFIDGLIPSLVLFISLIIAETINNLETYTFFVLSAIGLLFLFIYQAFLLTTKGQSIGKILMKIKIIDYRTNENGGFVQNFLLRSFANSMLTIIPLYGLVDKLFIFSADSRCLHDLISGTKVVRSDHYVTK